MKYIHEIKICEMIPKPYVISPDLSIPMQHMTLLCTTTMYNSLSPITTHSMLYKEMHLINKDYWINHVFKIGCSRNILFSTLDA